MGRCFFGGKNGSKPTLNQWNDGIWYQKVQKTSFRGKKPTPKKKGKSVEQGHIEKIAPEKKGRDTNKKLKGNALFLAQKRATLNRICLSIFVYIVKQMSEFFSRKSLTMFTLCENPS